MSTTNFSCLPFELRELIYQKCISDREARLNILTLNREIHGEVESLMYSQRNLVFHTHPDVILNHEVKSLRQLQNGLVTVSLEHAHKAPIMLPPLPWKKRRCEAEPSYRHLPIDYLIHKGKGKIIIHVYEPPKEDSSQVAMSYWAINGIHEFLQELYPDETLRLHIITHPLSQTTSFVDETRITNITWFHCLWKYFYATSSGDLSLILATLWADTDVYLDIHTTPAIAQYLTKFGFYSRPSKPKIGGRFIGFFPPLALSHDTKCMVPDGAVVTFRGNTWTSKDMDCRCTGIGCSCWRIDFALVATLAAVSHAAVREDRTSMAMRSMEDVDFKDFAWNKPDIQSSRIKKQDEESDAEDFDGWYSSEEDYY